MSTRREENFYEPEIIKPQNNPSKIILFPDRLYLLAYIKEIDIDVVVCCDMYRGSK